jgi:hypothetical protein
MIKFVGVERVKTEMLAQVENERRKVGDEKVKWDGE